MNERERLAAFLEELRREATNRDAYVAERVFEWAKANGMRLAFQNARNAHGDGVLPVIKGVDWEPTPFAVSSVYPHVWLQLDNLSRHAPFKAESKRNDVVTQLYAIPGVIKTEKNIYPHIRLADLDERETWDQFFGVIQGILNNIKRAAELGLR